MGRVSRAEFWRWTRQNPSAQGQFAGELREQGGSCNVAGKRRGVAYGPPGFRDAVTADHVLRCVALGRYADREGCNRGRVRHPPRPAARCCRDRRVPVERGGERGGAGAAIDPRAFGPRHARARNTTEAAWADFLTPLGFRDAMIAAGVTGRCCRDRRVRSSAVTKPASLPRRDPLAFGARRRRATNGTEAPREPCAQDFLSLLQFLLRAFRSALPGCHKERSCDCG